MTTRAHLTTFVSGLCLALMGCGEAPASGDADEGGQEDAAPDDLSAPSDAQEDQSQQADTAPDAPPDVHSPGEEAPTEPPFEWPMEPLAAQGAWGPAGRVVWLDSPETAQEAREAGCALEGASGGTSLNSLVTLAGGLPPLVRPGPQGQVTLNLLARLEGWAPGQRAEDLTQVDLSVLAGAPSLEPSLLVDAASFEGDDPTAPPRNHYPASEVHDGWLRSSEARFTFSFSLLGFPIRISMSRARMAGRVYADGAGVGMREGVLMGYMSSQDIIDTLRGLVTTCEAPSPPALCGALQSLLPEEPTDEALLRVGSSFIGALDTALDERAYPYPCDPQAPGSCNALSVCFLLHLDGVAIDGVQRP